MKTRTSPSRRCTWMRAPSSFHSIAAGEMRSSAASTSAAVPASIGATGRPTSSPIRRRPSTPSASAVSAAAARSPPSIAARRTSATGTAAAWATASVMTPASAPWRRSPRISATRNSCSGARRAAEEALDLLETRRSAIPGPASVARRSRAASTSPTVSAGSSAGAGRLRSAAQPAPGLALARRAGEERDAGGRLGRARGRAGSRPGGRSWPCATRFRARTARRRRAGRAACRGRVASPCRVPAP